MKDTAYVVVAAFPANSDDVQIWRGGVFDSPEEAIDEFDVFRSSTIKEYAPGFIRVQAISPEFITP